MTKIENIQSVYFIGIGGIGMSALARYFRSRGAKVAGYDRSETPLTRALVSEGIDVIFDDDASLVPKDAELVVYTPAVPASHSQLRYFQNNGYQVVKRSQVLGAITENSFNICIGGTHGKTTISTMVAHILRHSGYGCNAFLGGIAANYNSNFWSSDNNTCVIEADEYDRSFLKLSPDIAVITAMDADHLDIYGNEKAMEDAFIEFSSKVKSDGVLFFKKSLRRGDELRAPVKVAYHISDSSADVHVKNIQQVNGYYMFDVQIGNDTITDVALNMGGRHNVENASVAIAVARRIGIEPDAIRQAVEEFKGVKRRFEYIIKKKHLVYIDDYAHHPEELATLISSARSLFPDLRCTVIFQPHLYSRTRDLATEFAESLDLADEIILLPIYPARELPIEGVSSELIKEAMKKRNVKIADRKDVIQNLRNNELVITAGAGDIDTLVNSVKQFLTASR